MAREDVVRALKDAGYDDSARSVEAITPEQEAAFEEWLSDPQHKQDWDDALREAADA